MALVAVEPFGAGVPGADHPPDVKRVDGLVDRLQQGGQAAPPFLHELVGDVTDDGPGAGDPPAAVAGRGDRQGDLEAGAVLADHGLGGLHALAPGHGREDAGEGRRALRGGQHRHRLPDELVGHPRREVFRVAVAKGIEGGLQLPETHAAGPQASV